MAPPRATCQAMHVQGCHLQALLAGRRLPLAGGHTLCFLHRCLVSEACTALGKQGREMPGFDESPTGSTLIYFHFSLSHLHTDYFGGLHNGLGPGPGSSECSPSHRSQGHCMSHGESQGGVTALQDLEKGTGSCLLQGWWVMLSGLGCKASAAP